MVGLERKPESSKKEAPSQREGEAGKEESRREGGLKLTDVELELFVPSFLGSGETRAGKTERVEVEGEDDESEDIVGGTIVLQRKKTVRRERRWRRKGRAHQGGRRQTLPFQPVSSLKLSTLVLPFDIQPGIQRDAYLKTSFFLILAALEMASKNKNSSSSTFLPSLSAPPPRSTRPYLRLCCFFTLNVTSRSSSSFIYRI